jgi:hypothetical protein
MSTRLDIDFEYFNRKLQKRVAQIVIYPTGEKLTAKK